MWIMAGFDLLVHQGPNSLTIQRLCEKLNVTKGAFYHWFKSKSELDMALLEAWSDHSTNSLIQLAARKSTPSERLQAMIHEGFVQLLETSTFNDVEIALEAWALSEPKVQKFVLKIRCTRFDFLFDIFKEMGMDKKSASQESMKVYCLALGISHLPIRPSKTDLLEIFSKYF